MRLCGKCGYVGSPDGVGVCPKCRLYHGLWLDGFASLAEWHESIARRRAADPEMAALSDRMRAEYLARNPDVAEYQREWEAPAIAAAKAKP